MFLVLCYNVCKEKSIVILKTIDNIRKREIHMTDNLIKETTDDIPEFKKKIEPHHYTWKKYVCPVCGKEKKMSSIILKLYSVPKCCGTEMQCVVSDTHKK